MHCRQGRRPVQTPGARADGATSGHHPGADDPRAGPIPAGMGRLLRLQPVARVAIPRRLDSAALALRRLGPVEDAWQAVSRTPSPRRPWAGGQRGRFLFIHHVDPPEPRTSCSALRHRDRAAPRTCPVFAGMGDLSRAKTSTGWLGRQDSNLGMAESKSFGNSRTRPGSPIFRLLSRSWPFYWRSAFRIFALSERVLPTLQIPKTGKGCTTGGRGARAVVDFLT